MADPLATLHRLRRIQSDQARRDLATSLTAVRTAEEKLQTARAAMQAEAAVATTDPAHPLAGAYGRWLPAAQAKRAALAAAVQSAERDVAASRSVLAAARAAARAVEVMQEDRAAAVRLESLRREQVAADDLAGRRK